MAYGVNAGTIIATLALTTSPFKASLSSAMKDLRSFTDSSNNASQRISSLGSAANNFGAALSKGVTLPIVGVGAASLKMSMDFDAQMSRVQSIAGASGTELSALRDQAIQLGASTAFSASEAADGMQNLASAGFTTKEIMSAMPGLMDLAAASGEDLASSSDIAASTLRGFGLAASDAGHVADVLAKSANATNASVASTGEAMKYVAPVAHTMGLSMEEVTAAIGEMANQGIQGSQAGTTLRSAMISLAKPSKEAADLMSSIGFNAFDAQGKMLPLNEIMGNLQKSTSGMTQEQKANTLATIFGTEAMSGMQVLLTDGQDNLQKLTTELKNSDGAAKDAAKTNQDNLKGSIEQLQGALESAGIAIGEAMTPALRSLADHLGVLVDKFNSLSPGAKSSIVIFGGIAAAIGPVLLILAQFINAFLTVKKAMVALSGLRAVSAAIGGLKVAFGALLSPIGLVILAIAGIALAIYEIKKHWDVVGPYFTAAWNTIVAGFNYCKDAIVGAWNSVVSFFVGIGHNIANVWNGVISTIGAAFTASVNFIKSLWSGIVSFFVGIWNAIISTVGAFINAILTFFAPLIQGIIAGIQLIKDGVVSVFSGIINVIKAVLIGPILLIIEAVVAIFTGGWGQVATDAMAIWNTLIAGLSAIWNGLVNIVKGIFTPIVAFFTLIFTNIWNLIVTIWTAIYNTVVTVVTTLVNGVISIWNGLVSFFTAMPGVLYNIAVSIFTFFYNGAINIFNTVASGIKDIWNAVVSFFQSMPGVLYNIAVSIFLFFKNGAWSIITTLGGWVVTAFNDFIKFFKDLPGNALEVGKNFISNLKNGIVNGVSDLVQAAKDLGNKILKAIRGVFGINSPSKETFKIGDYLIQGLANGISNGKNAVMSLISKVFGGAISFAKGLVGGSNLQGWLTSALAITGQPLSALPALVQIAMHESSGNPNDINLWDSNAKAGHPSKGLMQMIDETFNRWALPGMNDIWNPIDNAVSAIRYMINRYGSIWNNPGIRSMARGGSYVGYATGTKRALPGIHPIAENGFEVVMNRGLGLFQGGESVLNHTDSLSLLDTINLMITGITSLASSVQSGLSAIMEIFNGITSDTMIANKLQEANRSDNEAKKVEVHLNGKYAFTDKESIDYLATEVSKTVAGNVRRRK